MTLSVIGRFAKESIILNMSGESFIKRATQMQESYPVPKLLAAKLIKHAIKTRFNVDIDPNKTYFNRFKLAHTAPTFTGWAHVGPPSSSKTLTQAVLDNYNGQDQANPDVLNSYAGIYREGVGAELYDTHNELPLLPSAVSELIQGLDFSTQFKTYQDTFWANYADDFRILAKCQFYLQALKQREVGSLTEDMLQILLKGTGLDSFYEHTLQEALLLIKAPYSGVTVRRFDINGYFSSDLLLFQLDGQPTIVLYYCGHPSPFKIFPNRKYFNKWVIEHRNTVEQRNALASHFSNKVRQDGVAVFGRSGVDSAFKGLISGKWGTEYINYYQDNVSSLVKEDIFVSLTNCIKERDYSDAETAITSNDEVNTEIYLTHLKVFSTVSMAGAPLFSPINLALALSSIGRIYLGARKIVQGDTTNDRNDGLLNAAGGLLDLGSVAIPLLEKVPAVEKNIFNEYAESETTFIDKHLQENPADQIPLLSFDEESETQWLSDPTEIDLSGIQADEHHCYRVSKGLVLDGSYILHNNLAYKVTVFVTGEVELADAPFTPIIFYDKLERWLPTVELANILKAHRGDLIASEVFQSIGWTVTAGQENAIISQRVMLRIRKAYNEGYKSGNKVYTDGPKSLRYKGRDTIADDIIKRLRERQQQIAAGTLTPRDLLLKEEWLAIDAANCGELAQLSAKMVINRRAYAELWAFEDMDHAFTVVGKPPMQRTIDFSEWKDVWIIDAWANINCEAKDYLANLEGKMFKWARDGKQIYIGGQQIDPTNNYWLDAIREKAKVRIKAPSIQNDNPWLHYSLELSSEQFNEYPIPPR